jgi:hypothetical protein
MRSGAVLFGPRGFAKIGLDQQLVSATTLWRGTRSMVSRGRRTGGFMVRRNCG